MPLHLSAIRAATGFAQSLWLGTALTGAELLETAINIARPHGRRRRRVFTLGGLSPRHGWLAVHPWKYNRLHRPRIALDMLLHGDLTLYSYLTPQVQTQALKQYEQRLCPLRRQGSQYRPKSRLSPLNVEKFSTLRHEKICTIRRRQKEGLADWDSLSDLEVSVSADTRLRSLKAGTC
jgi:hypothetical protein